MRFTCLDDQCGTGVLIEGKALHVTNYSSGGEETIVKWIFNKQMGKLEAEANVAASTAIQKQGLQRSHSLGQGQTARGNKRLVMRTRVLGGVQISQLETRITGLSGFE